MAHPLDRPVWNALRTRQAHLAAGDEHALRFRPDINLFAAAADRSEESVAALDALLPAGGAIGLVETDEWPFPAGLVTDRRPLIHQMVAETITPGPAIDHVVLGDEDAADMLELAAMTNPGPFFTNTHKLGRFIGVREGGRLIAMAGERMKVKGFSEVSAVCTHPDYRGRGLAGALMRVVAERMVAQGDTPFLHTYAENVGAVRLYEAIGFRVRAAMLFTILRRPTA